MLFRSMGNNISLKQRVKLKVNNNPYMYNNQFIKEKEHSTDISALYGTGISVENIEDTDTIGTPYNKINIKVTSSGSSQSGVDGELTYVGLNQDVEIHASNTYIEPIDPISLLPEARFVNGILMLMDDNGVNTYAPPLPVEENPYGPSLFGPMQNQTMSPGYNYFGYGNMSNYYNPLLIQQQKEEEERIKQENTRLNNSINTRLYKTQCSIAGEEVDEDIVNMINGTYDDSIINQLSSEERVEYERLKRKEEERSRNNELCMRLEATPYYINQRANAWRDAYSQFFNQNKIPDNIGLQEYLRDYAPRLLMDAYDAKSRENDKNIILGLSNDVAYNKALEDARVNMYDDDTAIHLPNGYDEYNAISSYHDKAYADKALRRKQFFDSIISGRTAD